MPGYEKTRFVNLTKNESQQLMCGICHAILSNPKYTKCCEQAYCLDCIEQWLLNSETCPNDRKQLKRDELCNLPKFVNNMLLEMVLSCQFNELGCSEVLKLELIDHHEFNCKFNPQAICQNCLSENGERSKHQCIKNLKRKYLKAEERNKELTKELDILIGNYSYETEKLIDNLRISKKELAEVKEGKKILENQIERLDNESKQMQETISKSEGIIKINQQRIIHLEENLKSAKNKFLLFHNNAILSYTTMQKSFDIQSEITKKSYEKIINDNKMFIQNSSKITESENLPSTSTDEQKVSINKIINIIDENLFSANENKFNIYKKKQSARTRIRSGISISACPVKDYSPVCIKQGPEFDQTGHGRPIQEVSKPKISISRRLSEDSDSD